MAAVAATAVPIERNERGMAMKVERSCSGLMKESRSGSLRRAEQERRYMVGRDSRFPYNPLISLHLHCYLQADASGMMAPGWTVARSVHARDGDDAG